MSIIKDVCIEIIKRMPENVTIEDIVEEILFMGNIYKSLKPDKRLKIKTEELLELYFQKRNRYKICESNFQMKLVKSSSGLYD